MPAIQISQYPLTYCRQLLDYPYLKRTSEISYQQTRYSSAVYLNDINISNLSKYAPCVLFIDSLDIIIDKFKSKGSIPDHSDSEQRNILEILSVGIRRYVEDIKAYNIRQYDKMAIKECKISSSISSKQNAPLGSVDASSPDGFTNLSNSDDKASNETPRVIYVSSATKRDNLVDVSYTLRSIFSLSYKFNHFPLTNDKISSMLLEHPGIGERASCNLSTENLSSIRTELEKYHSCQGSYTAYKALMDEICYGSFLRRYHKTWKPVTAMSRDKRAMESNQTASSSSKYSQIDAYDSSDVIIHEQMLRQWNIEGDIKISKSEVTSSLKGVNLCDNKDEKSISQSNIAPVKWEDIGGLDR